MWFQSCKTLLQSVCFVATIGLGTFIPHAGTSAELHHADGRAGDRPDLQSFLTEARLDDGAAAFRAYLEQEVDDSDAIASLGVIEFLAAIENFGQSLHEHGAENNVSSFVIGRGIPLFRMPVPKNSTPAPITYGDVRKMLETLVSDLEKAASTLKRVDGAPIAVTIQFDKVHLDLNDDGQTGDKERIVRIYSALNANARQLERAKLTVGMDLADVHWLCGYCHLISAMAESLLAYDFSESFESCGHLIFPEVSPEHPILKANQGLVGEVLDEVALLHTIRWPVVEPERMRSAHQHLLEVIRHSRLTWDAIDKEMDDNNEWIPGPNQTSIFPNGQVTAEMVAAWLEFIDEAEKLLTGELLVPFWAVSDPIQGVNLQRVFLEPREFDGILWFAGTGALPYVEEGRLSEPATWERFQRVFGGEFIGFAIWFN